MRYITCPGSADRQLFESGFSRVRATGRPIVLSRQYLAQFGRFRIPAPLWQALGQYACWLDLVIVREWRQLTANRDSTGLIEKTAFSDLRIHYTDKLTLASREATHTRNLNVDVPIMDPIDHTH